MAGTMNFFRAQDEARGRTTKLVALLVLAIVVLAGTLYADADGNLFTSSTPDIGAFQNGGTPVTEPSLGGGGGSDVLQAAPLTLRLNLRI